MNGVSISRHRFLSLWLMRLPPGPLAAEAALGLKPGLALAEARARYPDLAVVAEHAADDRRLLDGIADWCQRYTPLLAVDPPDGLLLDIAGCAHLYGGEQKLLADLLARIARFGFAARGAVASSIGAAFAAARYGEAGRGA